MDTSSEPSTTTSVGEMDPVATSESSTTHATDAHDSNGANAEDKENTDVMCSRQQGGDVHRDSEPAKSTTNGAEDVHDQPSPKSNQKGYVAVGNIARQLEEGLVSEDGDGKDIRRARDLGSDVLIILFRSAGISAEKSTALVLY